MKNITLLIKPASSLCNMRCRYCFYADIAQLRSTACYGRMQSETSQAVIRRTFEEVSAGGQVNFIFQGGEPTLAGLDYFREFTALAAAARPLDVKVSYAIQTNGLLLNEEWADFLKENQFLVGISVDGYRELHDRNRVDPAGKGTYSRIEKTVRLLLKKQIPVNLLCVVTSQCARHPEKVYEGLKKLNSGFLQFIPCLDPLEEARGGRAYSLKPDEYGNFLCTLFELWFRDWQQGHYTSVRLFEDYVHLAMGLPPSNCASGGGCGSYFVIEGDGSVYPCDFFVVDAYRMGNIRENTLAELARSDGSRRFLTEGRQRPAACASCPWLRLCLGGCRRDWLTGPEGTENYYCGSFRQLFACAADRIAYIARLERRARGGR